MSYKRKIMSLDLSAERPDARGYYYTELLLPAEDYEIRDAIQQLRAIGREDSVWISVFECSELLPALVGVRLDSPTLDELNFFAKRLDSLSFEERLAFRAVSHRILPENPEGEIVSMKELINSTYGLDTVMIAANVGNDEELGQFVIEEDLNEDVASVPDNALYLLDRKQIGKMQREMEGGVFLDGFYVITGDYEMPEVYDGRNLPESEKAEAFVFRMKIGEYPTGGTHEAEDDAEWMNLPTSDELAERIAAKYHEPYIQSCACYAFESAIPQITSEMFGDMADFDKLNKLAWQFQLLSPADQVKCKAVLEAEQPDNIEEALDIAKNLWKYEFYSNPETSEQFFKIYLNYHLGSRFDSEWLNSISVYHEGDELLKRLGASLTNYGVISAREHSLYELVFYNEPEVKELSAQGMTDEKLDVIEVLDRRALFANGRILPEEIPEGLYAYDLRESDDGDRFISIEPKVGVNHGGTVLMKEILDFGESGFISFDKDSDPNFLGYTMTPQEFAGEEQTEEENQEFGGLQL